MKQIEGFFSNGMNKPGYYYQYELLETNIVEDSWWCFQQGYLDGARHEKYKNELLDMVIYILN